MNERLPSESTRRIELRNHVKEVGLETYAEEVVARMLDAGIELDDTEKSAARRLATIGERPGRVGSLMGLVYGKTYVFAIIDLATSLRKQNGRPPTSEELTRAVRKEYGDSATAHTISNEDVRRVFSRDKNFGWPSSFIKKMLAPTPKAGAVARGLATRAATFKHD